MTVDLDTKIWQAHRLIKSDFDMRNVVAVLRSNAKALKDIFYALASADERYPKLGYWAFIDFCKSVRIIEDVTGKYPEERISKVDWLTVK